MFPSTPFAGILAFFFTLYFSVIYLVRFIAKNPSLQVISSAVISLILVVLTILLFDLFTTTTSGANNKESSRLRNALSKLGLPRRRSVKPLFDFSLLAAFLVFAALIIIGTLLATIFLAPQITIAILISLCAAVIIVILFNRGLLFTTYIVNEIQDFRRGAYHGLTLKNASLLALAVVISFVMLYFKSILEFIIAFHKT